MGSFASEHGFLDVAADLRFAPCVVFCRDSPSSRANQRLALVELATGRAAAGHAVIELPGSGELPVGASQEHGLQPAVPQREKLRALR